MWNFLRPTLLAIPLRKYTHHIVTVFTLTKDCLNIFSKEKSLWPIIWIYSSHSFLQPITIDIKIKIRKVSENMHNVFRIFVFPPGPDRRWWKRFPQLTWCASPFSESRKPDIINLYLGAQSSFSSMNCNQNNVDGSADHIIMLGDFVFCIHIIIIFLESSPECPRPCW